MAKSKYTYGIQCAYGGGWNLFIKEETRDYCEGYMRRAIDDLPRNHLQMVRNDGKVMMELKAYEDVGIGQIAGFPTPEQYERAANVALEKAARLRARITRGPSVGPDEN